MNEAEVEALMAGQEDENGCVNYEGLYWSIKYNYSCGLCVAKCWMIKTMVSVTMDITIYIVCDNSRSRVSSFPMIKHVVLKTQEDIIYIVCDQIVPVITLPLSLCLSPPIPQLSSSTSCLCKTPHVYMVWKLKYFCWPHGVRTSTHCFKFHLRNG